MTYYCLPHAHTWVIPSLTDSWVAFTPQMYSVPVAGSSEGLAERLRHFITEGYQSAPALRVPGTSTGPWEVFQQLCDYMVGGWHTVAAVRERACLQGLTVVHCQEGASLASALQAVASFPVARHPIPPSQHFKMGESMLPAALCLQGLGGMVLASASVVGMAAVCVLVMCKHQHPNLQARLFPVWQKAE